MADVRFFPGTDDGSSDPLDSETLQAAHAELDAATRREQ